MLSVPFLEISRFIDLWLEQPLEPIVKFPNIRNLVSKMLSSSPAAG